MHTDKKHTAFPVFLNDSEGFYTLPSITNNKQDPSATLRFGQDDRIYAVTLIACVRLLTDK